MEGTSKININEVIEILRESVLNVTIKEDSCRIYEDVKATQFLYNCESHLVLLHVDA